MSIGQQKKYNDNKFVFTYAGNRNVVNLTCSVALPMQSNKEVLINGIEAEKDEFIASFAHELKHGFDDFKNSETKIISFSEYRLFNSANYGIPAIDEFFHYLYFIHNTESLVRNTEIATGMEIKNISKKDFINFLTNNRVYKMLKDINGWSYEKFRQELINDKDSIIKALDGSNISIPSNDNELVDLVLDLFYTTLTQNKIDGLKRVLYKNPVDILLDRPDSEKSLFLKNYSKSVLKYKNYENYFKHEEVFKEVSSELIKKIHKLYDMAKDDNSSELMKKISAKQTNESIHDWDLYHEINKTPISKFRTDL
jgi:hypothetical protein